MNKSKEKIELKVHKPKAPRMTSLEETIQLARLQQAVTSSILYEPKHNQKALKVVTVAAYILFVSMAAITLSFYYVFIWDPSTKPAPARSTTICDNKVVIPENLAIRLANSTEITAENFFKNIILKFLAIKHTKLNQTESDQLSLATGGIPYQNVSKFNQNVIEFINNTNNNNNNNTNPTTTIVPVPIENNNAIRNELSAPLSLSVVSQSINNNHRQDEDDEDADIDDEASGDTKLIAWNETLISLDEKH